MPNSILESKDAEYTPSSSSLAPSNPQPTPDSNRSDTENSFTRGRIPGIGLRKLKTDFGMDQELGIEPESHRVPAQHLDNDEEYSVGKGYESPVMVARKRYTREEEQQVIKKFDRRLVLFMALLYLLSFLDRSNIGNAAIAGLRKDLDLSTSQYQWLLTAFYITYILFEWMTLMYRLVPPHIYISLCVLSWGLVASFQALVTSFSALVFLRALLGITEAAFGPGVPFYLSFFYKREELAFRTGLFVSAAPLATSFASSLAWLIVKLGSNGPIAPWRTLFLVEGFPSVIVAVFAWVYVPDGPGKARYLTPRERKVAKLRLGQKGAVGSLHGSRKGQFDWQEIGRTIRDPKSYVTAFMFFSCNVSFSSLPVFLPTIINDMGYSSLAAQGLSAPPYLFSFVIVLITAFLSDRSRSRSPYLITHALLSAVSYLLIGLTGIFHAHLSITMQTLIKYVCIFPAASGFFSAITIIIAWTMDNRPAKEGKGTGMAILNIIGQCGPLLGTRLYPEDDRPYYTKGMIVCSVFMLIVAILAFTLRKILQRENQLLELKRAPFLATGRQSQADGEIEGLIESNDLQRQYSGEEFTYII